MDSEFKLNSRKRWLIQSHKTKQLAKSRKNNEFLVNPSEKSSFHSELANNKWIHYKFVKQIVIHGEFSKMKMDL